MNQVLDKILKKIFSRSSRNAEPAVLKARLGQVLIDVLDAILIVGVLAIIVLLLSGTYINFRSLAVGIAAVAWLGFCRWLVSRGYIGLSLILMSASNAVATASMLNFAGTLRSVHSVLLMLPIVFITISSGSFSGGLALLVTMFTACAIAWLEFNHLLTGSHIAPPSNQAIIFCVFAAMFFLVSIQLRRHFVAVLQAMLRKDKQLSDVITGFNSLETGLVLYGPDDNLVFCNRRFQEIYTDIEDLLLPGTPYEEICRAYFRKYWLAGKYTKEKNKDSYSNVDVPIGINYSDEQSYVQARLKRHQGLDLNDYEFQLADGTWMLASDRKTPDGGTIGMRIDITARKIAEAEVKQHRDGLAALVKERTRELEEALVEAQEADRAKSEFLANMSHELRTPMHAILSFSNLGLDRADPTLHNKDPSWGKKLHGYFNNIKRSGQRLLSLLNDLLDLSKLEAGQMPLHIEEKDIVDLVNYAVEDLSGLIASKEIRILTKTEFSKIIVKVDPHRMMQVIVNLLSNSIKFTPNNSEITIELSTNRSDFTLKIADEGPGIPTEELERIFEKFIQSSTTKSGAGGTGLGLAICKQIVQLHGGTIDAKNRSTQGALFTVNLSDTVVQTKQDD